MYPHSLERDRERPLCVVNCKLVISLLHEGHKLFISNSGERALLVASKSAIFLWELSRDRGAVWWKIFPPEEVLLPDLEHHREAVIDAGFHAHPVSLVVGVLCVYEGVVHIEVLKVFLGWVVYVFVTLAPFLPLW